MMISRTKSWILWRQVITYWPLSSLNVSYNSCQLKALLLTYSQCALGGKGCEFETTVNESQALSCMNDKTSGFSPNFGPGCFAAASSSMSHLFLAYLCHLAPLPHQNA